MLTQGDKLNKLYIRDYSKGGIEMIDGKLIRHCSPTLAGMKTGSLFNCSVDSKTDLTAIVDKWNEELMHKGISFLLLRMHKDAALIYVFRRSRLEADLKKDGVFEFLCSYGYKEDSADSAIKHLKSRIGLSGDFPHEIGLFLGYPLGDVKGFIENAGKNSKCTGCWKVYCDECEALKLFRKYKKCTDVYCEMFKKGVSVMQLTVAA